ncbi:MAG: LacI family DNA-binding transcriptional regulator [Gemmatimonadaceae bacterium]|jgi:LacI family transcriptional regulator
MAGRRVTLKDIARHLGLSLPTVSRALADHPDISDETKARVREAAQAMHYVPNLRARYLRAKSSRLLALIMPEMHMFFFPSLMTGVSRVAQENDYSLIVFQSDNSVAQEKRLIEYCTHLSVDGVLLALSAETTDLAHLDILHDCGIPVVLMDTTIETTKYSTVTIDDQEAGREAAAYLLDRGHRRIIGVFGDQRQRISVLRHRGFKQAHAERGAKLADSQVVRMSAGEPVEPALHRALDAHPDATAVFAMTDEMLMRSHYVLMQRGKRVPEDVSLLAISDGLAPALLHPNVTHFRHSGMEVGERTAHILIGLIAHRSEAMLDVRIRTTLVENATVATLGELPRP